MAGGPRRNRAARGWLLEDGSHYMTLFDDLPDANRGLTVARGASRQCFVGRSNSRPDRYSYLFTCWQ